MGALGSGEEQQADKAGSRRNKDQQNNDNGDDLEDAWTPLCSGKSIKKGLSTFFHVWGLVSREYKAACPEYLPTKVFHWQRTAQLGTTLVLF